MFFICHLHLYNNHQCTLINNVIECFYMCLIDVRISEFVKLICLESEQNFIYQVL